VEALVNTPLSDVVALRVSAISQQDRGWAYHQWNGSHMGDSGDRGLRAAVRWQGNGNSAILGFEHEVMREAGPAVFSVTGGKINFGAPTTWTDPLKQPLINDATPEYAVAHFRWRQSAHRASALVCHPEQHHGLPPFQFAKLAGQRCFGQSGRLPCDGQCGKQRPWRQNSSSVARAVRWTG
jgi:hypothetical protein